MEKGYKMEKGAYDKVGRYEYDGLGVNTSLNALSTEKSNRTTISLLLLLLLLNLLYNIA